VAFTRTQVEKSVKAAKYKYNFDKNYFFKVLLTSFHVF